MHRLVRRLVVLLASVQAIWSVSQLAAAEIAGDPLKQSFISPPESASPQVWWDWMNGNITEEGIKLDLQWMHRIGIGGVQSFDASFYTPQLLDHRLVFMTPSWKDALKYSVNLANTLGLEFSIASSPGWSNSGGPWVEPAEAMKKLVWSELLVKGGHQVRALPRPPAIVGPFQDVPWVNPMPGGPTPRESVSEWYRDVAVIAYRSPTDGETPREPPIVTSSAGSINASILWDGDFTKTVDLPLGERESPAWIKFDFRRQQTIQSMSLALKGHSEFAAPNVGAILEASRDGSQFRTITSVLDNGDIEQTVSFPPIRARFFRLVLPPPPPVHVSPVYGAYVRPPQTTHQIAEFVLYETPKVDHFESKAGFFLDGGPETFRPAHLESPRAINQNEVLDLTSRLHSDGSLDWEAPKGTWVVLRVGYSLIGTTNHPAAAEATGLEVDKLSRIAVKRYMDNYLGLYQQAVGSELIGDHGVHGMVNDSWESQTQNWTDSLPEEFRRRRGYDLRLWLPVLTGRVIGSAETSERFLWDFRRTLSELVAESYYGQITASLRERRMIHYGESHENGRAFIGDGMDAKRGEDVPMGAMWSNSEYASPEAGDADLLESASVAHIYGQNLVAAESMTSVGVPGAAFAFSPERLKPIADREFSDGVNRLVIHTSVHQPLINKAPGVTLGPFGQWFTRNETWAEQASPWIKYLSRTSYLLQQGHFVADVLYFYGQDSNITALYGKHLPPVPEGYAFDFASADALQRVEVRDGVLSTIAGTRYRVLALDPRTRVMSFDVLKRISQLAAAGATVVGEKPTLSPSLADSSDDFRQLADTVWGAGKDNHYGKGRVISGISLSEAMAKLGVNPDFSYRKSGAGASVSFVHRHLEGVDLFFVDNRGDHDEKLDARFRIVGMAPEFWHADSGVVEDAPFRQVHDATIVPMTLASHESIFVMFRSPTTLQSRDAGEPRRKAIGSIDGPWQVDFQSEYGGAGQVTFARLKSWSADTDSRIKYFSGTARYSHDLNVPEAWLDGAHLEIDLGHVKDLAEVFVNGKSAGITWKPPFRIDITDLLKPGVNELTIAVTNLWVNRLIGDKQPNVTPVAFATFNPYGQDSPLLESGLIGPVELFSVSAGVPAGHGPQVPTPH